MSQQEFVFLDGNYIDAQTATIPVRTHAFLYGTSVFEGIRAYYNKEDDSMFLFRMKEHYERLARSAKIMCMEMNYSVQELCDITVELLKKNNYKTDAYVRPTIFKKGLTVCPGLYDNPDGTLIFTCPLGDYIDLTKGLSICVSSWRRVEDNAIPPRAKIAGGYANAALIVTDAKRAGFDDAIVLSENGHVTEGSAMNFFLVEQGKLITTKTTDNILVGVTRNTVIEIAKEEFGIETIERDIDRTELYIADEAFYCGTGAQISPITKIDNRPIGDGKVGEISKKIQALYFDVVRRKTEKYKKWCTAVK